MAKIKVISGGQTGVDRAGLAAARDCGFETGGYIPKGFRTLAGNNPWLGRMFGLVEMSSTAYPPRTEANIIASDATIQIAKYWDSLGEKLTSRLISKHGKPNVKLCPDELCSDFAVMLAERIVREGWKVVNVAGNSGRTWADGYQLAYDFLVKVFTLVKGENV